MYRLIGDMYRTRTVIPPIDTPVFPDPPYVGGSGPDDCVSSGLNAVWVTYPPSVTERQHILTRMRLDRTLALQAIHYERSLAPQDSEPLPELLVFHFDSAGQTTIQNIEELFLTNFGKIFAVRSNPHNKIFYGIIPEWDYEDNGERHTDFNFTLEVKESFNIGD